MKRVTIMISLLCEPTNLLISFVFVFRTSSQYPIVPNRRETAVTDPLKVGHSLELYGTAVIGIVMDLGLLFIHSRIDGSSRDLGRVHRMTSLTTSFNGSSS